MERRHERKGKGTSSKVEVKKYQDHENMKTTTKEQIMQYGSRQTNAGIKI